MTSSSDAMILRAYFNENDTHDGRPLYEALVYAAHKHGMAGATVLRGILGFGIKHHIHSAKILELSENMPVVVEIVDTEEKIRAFLPHVESMVKEGVTTLEKAAVIAHHS